MKKRVRRVMILMAAIVAMVMAVLFLTIRGNVHDPEGQNHLPPQYDEAWLGMTESGNSGETRALLPSHFTEDRRGNRMYQGDAAMHDLRRHEVSWRFLGRRGDVDAYQFSVTTKPFARSKSPEMLFDQVVEYRGGELLLLETQGFRMRLFETDIWTE